MLVVLRGGRLRSDSSNRLESVVNARASVLREWHYARVPTRRVARHGIVTRKDKHHGLNSISLRNYYSVYFTVELCDDSRARAVDQRGNR